MPATDISAGFIRDICERPHDDTPRLVYADWLEDRGGEIDRHRAEYIRVMVELEIVRAKYKAVPQAVWEKLERLRQEEAEGWPTLSESYGSADYEAIELNDRYHALLATDAAKFMGDRWYPPWAETDYFYYTVDWSRGFIFHINIDCAGWLKYGPEIVQVHPITSVRLTDREPRRLVEGSKYLWWIGSPFLSHTVPHFLPAGWFRKAQAGYRFLSREAAQAWASSAGLAWSRDAAGLPPLVQCPTDGQSGGR